jgi:hypothetical protein
VTLPVLASSTHVGSVITGIRVADPLRAVLAARGGELRLAPYHYVGRADLAWARVFVAQRGTASRHERLMRWARDAGAAVIYELDDLLTELAPHLVHHRQMQRARPWVLRCLAQADLVTVSTQRLADELGLAPERCRVVPNTTMPCADLPLPEAGGQGPVTLLFASSDRIAGAGLFAAVRALRAQLGERLQVVGVGLVGDDLAAAGIEARRVLILPRPQFVEFARSLPDVLAVIPLDASRFSACKSAIKWFDYAEAGVPTLASDVSPYREVMRNNLTGALVGDSEAAWTAAIRRAIDDPGWRRRIAAAARAEVRARHHFGRMADAWSGALDAALAIAARRPRPAPLAWERAAGDAAGWLDARLIALRRFNRDRIARRRGAPR